MSEFHEAALRYCGLGLSVIPLRPRGKIPIFGEWQKIASKDADLVGRWWAQNPDSNVGIATGPKSSCFVLDVDIAKGGQDSYDALLAKYGQFPDTWQQITGSGGFHLFFRYPTFRVQNANDLLPGIDIRGDGGQVVAPPSIHPSGTRYEWDGLREIENTPMAEAPMWLLEMLQGKSERPAAKAEKLPVANRIPNGTRHKALVAMAGTLRRMGLSASEILPSLREVNRLRCETPKEDSAVMQIAESMMNYQPSDSNLVATANKLWRVTKAREMEEAERKQDTATALQSAQVQLVDGLEVYRTPQTEQRCLVDGLLYHGLTIFAGSPKSGKSWLALQLALAVANGERFLGQRDVLRPGRVVYAALEESAARTSSRMRKLQPVETVFLRNISMVYNLMPLMSGGAEQLDEIAKKLSPSLLIVDTFLAVVGSGGKGKDVLRSEYNEMNVLHKLAEKHDTAILVIHHKRKAVPGSSSLDSVSGTAGLTAAADSIWTIDREDAGVSSISIVGRDIEDQTLALKFQQEEPFGWQLIGTGDGVKSMKAEREIYSVLREEGALSPAKVALLIRMNVNEVREIMYDLSKRGFVTRNPSGQYYLSPGGERMGEE